MSVLVVDPFGVTDDPKMPFLVRALDPVEVQRQFGRHVPRLAGKHGLVHLLMIRVTRYKPGRRCLIEYDLEVIRPDVLSETITLLGKARARGLDRSDYHLLKSLWNAGFGDDSEDGISVPEPIGIIPEFQMWLQCKVLGRVATELLAAPDGEALAQRIAEAAYKLHRAGVPAKRRHTMADELFILRECLPIVAQTEPRWAGRIERLLDACNRLGAATPEPMLRGIHRDFYADQVIVDGLHLYLTDFDLYCEGDPNLDIGNFLGHVTEQSLRTLGDPEALADVERVMEERFVELSSEATHAAVRAYATLTLVRHIYLSTQFPERRPFTGSLLELCEERLGVAGRIHA